MSSGAWTTENELTFLKLLGTCAPLVSASRKELLQSYAQSLALRQNWDRMDQHRVQSAVQRYLAEEK